MSKPAVTALAVRAPQQWKNCVEAAILETNPDNMLQRIQDSQEAVMDEIEDSFCTASQTERQSLMNAMNALYELRRLSQTHASQAGVNMRELVDAA